MTGLPTKGTSFGFLIWHNKKSFLLIISFLICHFSEMLADFYKKTFFDIILKKLHIKNEIFHTGGRERRDICTIQAKWFLELSLGLILG